MRAGHVFEYRFDSSLLIRRFFKRERIGKRRIFDIFNRKGMALLNRSFGMNLQQFRSNVPDALNGFLLDFAPLVAAQFMQGAFSALMPV
jgi:hypothetical protein